MRTPSVRDPAVAGAFYPDDPTRLRTLVHDLLSAAATAPGDRPLRAIIAPHAGYVYSGAVAAGAHALLAPLADRIRRAVVIGPAHFAALRGLAAPTCDAFATPLGDVPLDRDAIEALGALPQVSRTDAPHRREHSIEVQLPFLQAVLREFRLVPLAVGEASAAEVAEVLAMLCDGKETVLVVSSDLSHYEGYDAARRHDAETARSIEALEEKRIGLGDACGCRAIAGLLVEARRRRLRARRLDLRNSGDTAGPKGRVVGYGAWTFEDWP